MKAIVSGLIWAAAILAIALASRGGLIARGDAANVILVLAVLSAIQIGTIARRARSCAACGEKAR